MNRIYNNAKVENRKNIDLERSYCRTYMEHGKTDRDGKCVRCGKLIDYVAIC
jgi:hypothetical protein